MFSCRWRKTEVFPSVGTGPYFPTRLCKVRFAVIHLFRTRSRLVRMPVHHSQSDRDNPVHVFGNQNIGNVSLQHSRPETRVNGVNSMNRLFSIRDSYNKIVLGGNDSGRRASRTELVPSHFSLRSVRTDSEPANRGNYHLWRNFPTENVRGLKRSFIKRMQRVPVSSYLQECPALDLRVFS